MGFNSKYISRNDVQTYLIAFQSQASPQISKILPSGYTFIVNVTQMAINSKQKTLFNFRLKIII